MKLYHSIRRLALSSTFHRLKTATLLRVLKMLLPADGGAALVEGALILPVFLLLVGGVYEFGFFLYQEQLVTSGIEDAARYLALSADPTGTNIQADAKNLAVTGSINGGPSRVNGWSTSDVDVTVDSVDNTSGTYSGGSTIQIVTVSTKYLDPTLGFLTLLHLKPPTISVSHQERVVGGSAPGQG